MIWILMLGGTLLGLYLFRSWSLKAGPARTTEALRRAALIAFLALFLLVLMRSGPLAAALLPLLLPLFLRWQRGGGHFAPADAGGASNDAQSTVETRFLSMSLDHATGTMRGTVLAGRFAGRQLEELTPQQLLSLWQECQADAQSAAVLEAYMDRTQPEDWRSQVHDGGSHGSGSRAGNTTGMDRQEAYEILGLAPEASREDIIAAHRRLMQRVHPDHGGSTYLAARINQAKDLLLGDDPS